MNSSIHHWSIITRACIFVMQFRRRFSKLAKKIMCIYVWKMFFFLCENRTLNNILQNLWILMHNPTSSLLSHFQFWKQDHAPLIHFLCLLIFWNTKTWKNAINLFIFLFLTHTVIIFRIHSFFTAPPSPLTLNSSNLSSAGDYSDHNSSGNSSVIGGQQIYRSGSMHHNIPLNAAVASQLHHTMQHRQGSCSPPLPPPPTIEDEHARFGQPAGSQSHPIMSDELDLPGWVPKNYIEKGMRWF